MPSSSSPMASSTPLDPLSMTTFASLDPKALWLSRLPITAGLIDYFIDTLTSAVARSATSPGLKNPLFLKSRRFVAFVHTFVDRIATARITNKATQATGPMLPYLNATTILAATTYVDRVDLKLFSVAEQGQCLCERIACAALMLAYKNHHDAQPINSHWAACTGTYNTRDVLEMEYHLLTLIDYRVIATQEDLLRHFEPVVQYMTQEYEEHAALEAHKAVPHLLQPLASRVAPDWPPSPAPTPSGSSCIPGELMYPDSPMVDDDDFDGYEFDSSSSDEESSSGYVTPHDSTEPPTSLSAAAAAATAATKPVPNPYLQSESRSHPASQTDTDTETHPLVQHYLDDRGTIADPDGSPRYVPYSPSEYQPQGDVEMKSAPAPVPSRPHAAAAPPCIDRQRQRQPWDQLQHWRSGPVSGDTTWGTLGLFRNA